MTFKDTYIVRIFLFFLSHHRYHDEVQPRNNSSTGVELPCHSNLWPVDGFDIQQQRIVGCRYVSRSLLPFQPKQTATDAAYHAAAASTRIIHRTKSVPLQDGSSTDGSSASSVCTSNGNAFLPYWRLYVYYPFMCIIRTCLCIPFLYNFSISKISYA